MSITRRQLAKGIGLAALAGIASGTNTPSLAAEEAMEPVVPLLPARSEFAVGNFEVCLNNARWHPLSHGAKRAIDRYLDYKARGIWNPPDMVSAIQHDVKATFATMINADPTDIAYVTSTTAAESMLVSGLGITPGSGNIVTDALHFEGSLYLYGALQRQGVDVRVVRPRDWGIDHADLAAAIDGDTRLVAFSHVSYINGFEHDVKAVCDLAHAHGAIVYVDAVQAAGAIPIDVRASGVDVMACASYKWLMGDMGLGFAYARRDVVPRIRRTQFGYRQLADFQYHAFPWDAPGTYPVDWKELETAAGLFEIGTYSNATIAALSYSLPLLQRIGVPHVQQHAQSLLAHLRAELPRMGYACITPPESKGPIATFLVTEPKRVASALADAKVDVSLSPGRMRISPSIYTDHRDIEKLLVALR